MVAFEGATELGYRHLETDLHVTADGVVVCIHDPTVDRTTNGRGPVERFTFDELSKLDAGYRHHGPSGYGFRESGAQVPSLEEVVSKFPEASFVVDMKADSVVQPLASLIRRLELEERLIVGAFSDDRLEMFRQASGGGVATSTGPALTRLWVIASRMGRGAGGAAQALQVPTQIRGVRIVDQKLIEAAHETGLQVHVWTVNDRYEMERLLDLGVDGVVTDRIDVLKEVLAERGEWPK